MSNKQIKRSFPISSHQEKVTIISSDHFFYDFLKKVKIEVSQNKEVKKKGQASFPVGNGGEFRTEAEKRSRKRKKQYEGEGSDGVGLTIAFPLLRRAVIWERGGGRGWKARLCLGRGRRRCTFAWCP